MIKSTRMLTMIGLKQCALEKFAVLMLYALRCVVPAAVVG